MAHISNGTRSEKGGLWTDCCGDTQIQRVRKSNQMKLSKIRQPVELHIKRIKTESRAITLVV